MLKLKTIRLALMHMALLGGAVGPDFIADNMHMPQGQGIAEMAKVPRIELRNYPDPAQKNLEDMLKGNAEKLGISIK